MKDSFRLVVWSSSKETKRFRIILLDIKVIVKTDHLDRSWKPLK